jgi:endoglucanase
MNDSRYELRLPPTQSNEGFLLSVYSVYSVVHKFSAMKTSTLFTVKRGMRLLFLFTPLWFCLVLNAQPQPLDAFEQNRRLGRGVNIIGYDPIWRSRDQAHFQDKHFQALKTAGFQSVRVNLHPFRYMNPTNGWALDSKWLQTLDWAVDRGTAAGLQVILDFHEFNRMGEEPEKHKPQFLAFWEQLAEHCKNAPNSVLFEILNEPNKKLTPALWNQYLAEALAVIRKTNPTRTVVVGPAFWNSVDHLQELELSEGDRHLIVTVHYYKPMSFTHQGAAWTDQKDKTGIEWGTEAERKAVANDFATVAAWAKAHDRPILLGEFGAYDKGPMEARARYTAVVARTAEAAGWSWAYWQFDSDFILWDMKSDSWVEPILHALIP